MTPDERLDLEIDACQAIVLDAEVRSARIRRAADRILVDAPLEEVLRGVVIDHLGFERGSWCAIVRCPDQITPSTGTGDTIAMAIRCAMRTLATEQEDRANRAVQAAHGWRRAAEREAM